MSTEPSKALGMAARIDIDTIFLGEGAHESFEHGVCALELSSYLAGEKFSDHPKCVSPVIATYIRELNDSWNDETRQLLKPYIVKILNTAGADSIELRRSQLAIDWIVRTYAPAWLELAGLSKEAQALRDLPELIEENIDEARGIIERTEQKCFKGREALLPIRVIGWNAVWESSWDPSRTIAGNAARVAASDTELKTEWYVVQDTAWSIGWDAAWIAGLNAARAVTVNSTRDASAIVRERFKPTVTALQTSALELIDRMVGVTTETEKKS
jgi:hypothetical protein